MSTEWRDPKPALLPSKTDDNADLYRKTAIRAIQNQARERPFSEVSWNWRTESHIMGERWCDYYFLRLAVEEISQMEKQRIIHELRYDDGSPMDALINDASGLTTHAAREIRRHFIEEGREYRMPHQLEIPKLGAFPIRTAADMVANWKSMPRDPTKGIRPLRDPHGKTEWPWWTTEEVAMALDCARQVDDDLIRKDGHRTATTELMVALGCLLGLRYEEMVMLRWEDLDLEAKHAQTGRPEPVCRVRSHDGWIPKDGEARAIPVHADLATLLRTHRRVEGYILEPKKRMPLRGGRHHNYRYDPQALWNRLIRKVQERGGKRITPHGMRHSFASNLLIAGVSDVLVARWLGHADTSMLHERYGHLLAYHGDIDRVRLGPTP